ncbi:MAG: tRNA 2-thiouridine(34) synthase MnmA [Lachnospiraceae bacterium]|nr:tRNA 2-thiouridine(34) synthase MnmA [Lachnospiraceae bacterium]
MAKVIVGMSGGVDSAVAAYLLKKEGHEVIGITLRTWVAEDGTEGRCCEIDDARRVAFHLGIPYYAINCLSDFEKNVTEPFVDAYLAGVTPNPCILCNRTVKWERMLYMAKVLQADYVATGHYASVIKLANGRFTVRTASHIEKDQTYMLYALTQEQLAATLMPLGGLAKPEVRHIAEEAGLPVAAKQDSQEICFVPDGSYADYIEANAKTPVPGEGFFVDEAGRKLGKHKGIIHYTVGQRKGLGIALGHPVYVKEIRPDANEVVLGDEKSLYQSEILCRDVNYLGISGLADGERLRCMAKIRYHHRPQEAVITAAGPDSVRVSFKKPVRAAAPGQSAVFYDADGCVIGGGVIAV